MGEEERACAGRGGQRVVVVGGSRCHPPSVLVSTCADPRSAASVLTDPTRALVDGDPQRKREPLSSWAFFGKKCLNSKT